MNQNPFLAGVGRVLIFNTNDELIGVAKTLTESTFNHTLSTAEIRGGRANGLLGKYFYDSGLAVTLTDAMFDLNYVAMTLGSNVVSGGTCLYESGAAGETVSAGGTITLTHTPVAFDGTTVAWYKKPSDDNWTVSQPSAISGNTLTIDGAAENDKYCVKYFYYNESAKKVTIKVDRVPSIVHIVIINDLFSGKPTDGETSKWGRLITDIPAFQFSGSQDLSLSSTSAATVSLTGNALAVDTSDTCEEDAIYGTMVQEQFNADWREEVIALAAANSEISLEVGDSETAIIYAVFGGNVASSRKPNTYFTFTTDATEFTCSDSGVITATGAGTGTIEVNLTGYTDTVAPAFIEVTVTGE